MVGQRRQTIMGGHTTHTLRSIRKWGLLFALAGILTSCFGEIRTAVLSEPDVYSRIYEAKETVILRAIARVFKEKKIGTKVSIDYTDKTVNSDYLESDSWRTKACARISKLNWKECEVMLAITTEKKSPMVGRKEDFCRKSSTIHSLM